MADGHRNRLSRSVPIANRDASSPFALPVRLSLARHSWLALIPSRNLFVVSADGTRFALAVSRSARTYAEKADSGARPVGRRLSVAHPQPIPHAARGGQRGLCASSLSLVGSSQLATDHRAGRVRESAAASLLSRAFLVSRLRVAANSAFLRGRRRRRGRRRSTDRRCHPRDAAPTDGCHGARRRDHLTHGNDSRLVGGIVSRLV